MDVVSKEWEAAAEEAVESEDDNSVSSCSLIGFSGLQKHTHTSTRLGILSRRRKGVRFPHKHQRRRLRRTRSDLKRQEKHRIILKRQGGYVLHCEGGEWIWGVRRKEATVENRGRSG